MRDVLACTTHMPRPILLVDDDDAIKETLTEILEDDGYQVATAKDGQEALDYLRQHRDAPPGLILLDLMMPRMNGVQFLDAYRDDQTLPDVPVAVLSANPGLCRESRGVLLFLGKPVKLPNLLETVQRWCA